MTKIFTQDDLIRFLYNETSTSESEEITYALERDATLRERMNSLKQTVGLLNDSCMSPSESTTQSILNYSRSLRVAQ